MNERNIHVGDFLIAIGSYTAPLNHTHKYNITKGKKYKIIELNNTTFCVIDDFNKKRYFCCESLEEKSIFYMFNRVNVERVKKIKSLKLW